MADRRQHWENVYRGKTADQVGWFQPHAASSLRLIEDNAGKDAHIIDVGGGASVLVDDLLDAGYRNLPVLDLAESALEASRARLVARAQSVQWIVADITRAELPAERYDVWHDRAVFHFLTDRVDREKYMAALRCSLNPRGHVVIATFALDGPARCSGLEVAHYDAASLHAQFGADFEMLESLRETHVTPSGAEQRFTWARLRLR